jgi:putative cell wall-binding protein
MGAVRRICSLVCATVFLGAMAQPAFAVPLSPGDAPRGLKQTPKLTTSRVHALAVTSPDSFENDDTFAGASTLTPGVLSDVHNFFNASPPAESNSKYDIDYMKFDATAGHTYRVQTQFAGMPDGDFWTAPIELVLNDGSGPGGFGKILVYSEYKNGTDASNSEMCWTCPVSGTYFVRAGDWYQEYPDTQYRVLLDDLGRVATGSVSRIGGADRYEVAATLAQNSAGTYEGVTNFVIASGLDKSMADALSASGLAGALKAPVLLVRADRGYLPAPTLAAIQAAATYNHGATIQFHIVGGPASVPVGLERQLRAAASNKATIQRISGADRFAVSANVAADIRRHIPSYLLTAFVTNGQNATYFSDALAASPAAAKLAAPILLVKSTVIPPATAAALKYYPNRVLIGTVNKAIYEASVAKAVLGADYSKGVWITGSNRASIARHFAEFWEWQNMSELPVTGHYTATNMLSDALTAGSSPKLGGNFILYVDKGLNADRMVSYASDQFFQGHRASAPVLTIIGGIGSVDAQVESRLNYLVGNCYSSPAQEVGGTMLDNGFNLGQSGTNLGSTWLCSLDGGTARYSAAHPAASSAMGAMMVGADGKNNSFRETNSIGTTGTIEYRFWMYCDTTSGYRYVSDPVGPNGAFFIEWVEGGLVYIYLDRAGQPAPYDTADYHQIGTFTTGATEYRVTCNYASRTYTVSKRGALADDWVFMKQAGAPDNNIPMRSGSVSQSNGIGFQMNGLGNYWVDEVQYSKTPISDVPAVFSVDW